MRNVTLSLTGVSVIAATMMSPSPRGVVAEEQCAALPYVGLPFASGSTDGQAFAHHFMSKRSTGWKGTSDLLANDEQSDAPARFRTQCWNVFSNDFALENAQGDTLAHVDVDESARRAGRSNSSIATGSCSQPSSRKAISSNAYY